MNASSTGIRLQMWNSCSIRVRRNGCASSHGDRKENDSCRALEEENELIAAINERSVTYVQATYALKRKER